MNNIDALCLYAVGSSDAPYILAERFDIPEDDIEEILLDHNIEMCSGCGWWYESGDLTPDEDEGDSEELTGYCSDCRKEMRDD